MWMETGNGGDRTFKHESIINFSDFIYKSKKKNSHRLILTPIVFRPKFKSENYTHSRRTLEKVFLA